MEESIIESKIAERICISKEYTNEQYESEKIKLIRKSINDIFEDLYLELENCWKREVLSFHNGDLVYYPEINVMLERQNPPKFRLERVSINLPRNIQPKLLTEIGEKSEFLEFKEAVKIFAEYSNQIYSFKQIFCKSGQKMGCMIKESKDKYYFREIRQSNYITGLSFANDVISSARVPRCSHPDTNITKLEFALKYQIDISELEGKCAQIYVQLGELQRNKYIVIEHGKISLTKEGEKAAVSGKIKGININDISEKVQKINSLNVKNVSLKGKSVEEKKLYLADYLKCDKYRANIGEYDLKRLEDPNMGHWELWEGNEMPNAVSVSAEDRVIARNPAADIQEDSIVGIDFGTKSTVVVYQDRSGNIKPMPVGCGNIRKELSSEDFENPTVMQFINLEKFIGNYSEKAGRPYTKWNDLIVSHAANESMKDTTIRSDEFYSYMYDLKQWAGEGNKKTVIHDKSGKDILLNTYEEIINDGNEENNGEVIDPIELYAYYIGLYINNMNNGIYMDYVLSFPVTYEKKIREAILKSFSRGIKKSLPESILNDTELMKKFNVQAGTSEPAAYAICALERYGFEPEESDKVFYGIFDFGGGTADFDFGVWTASDNEDLYDYCIEHFGSEGDRYLGGENLLQLISFEVFKENIELCREKNITFYKPNEFIDVPVEMKGYVNESQEARINLKLMMEKLRPFWERREANGENSVDTETNGLNSEYSSFKLGLFNAEGEYIPNLILDADTGVLEEILRKRIAKGVRQFFNALKEIFSEKYLEKTLSLDKINIFLAGNSSKSPILKKVFDESIQEWSKNISPEFDSDETANKFFEVFPPLGTKEARAIQKERGIDDSSELESPTGKTGVAWGLIEGRKGGRIEIKEEITSDTEAKFAYYLGISVRKKFKVKILRDADYDVWYKFIPALKEVFEVNYTSIPEATNGKLPESDASVLRKRLMLDKCGEGLYVYIKLKGRDTIEYALGDENGNIEDDTVKNAKL